MVRERFAHEYTYDRTYRYRAQFRAAQREEKVAGLGSGVSGPDQGTPRNRWADWLPLHVLHRAIPDP